MKNIGIALITIAVIAISMNTVEADENSTAVAGYVYDSQGTPIRNAIVEFKFILKHQARQGLINPVVLTDSEGKYHIAGLPVARGWAKASIPGRGYDAFEVKLDGGRVNIINFKL